MILCYLHPPWPPMGYSLASHGILFDSKIYLSKFTMVLCHLHLLWSTMFQHLETQQASATQYLICLTFFFKSTSHDLLLSLQALNFIHWTMPVSIFITSHGTLLDSNNIYISNLPWYFVISTSHGLLPRLPWYVVCKQ